MEFDELKCQATGVRIWLACLATQELLCSYLGIRLGLYDALASGGPATPMQLADRVEISPRYAREWLEQQAAAGILRVRNCNAIADERVFVLPHENAVVLTA